MIRYLRNIANRLASMLPVSGIFSGYEDVSTNEYHETIDHDVGASKPLDAATRAMFERNREALLRKLEEGIQDESK